MALTIKKAVKHQAKIRLCLTGPSGAGKTYTALTFAKEMANGGKILVLDSEKGSASLYSDLFDFDVIELWSRDESRKPIADPFHPDKYIEAIRLAEEGGYAVLVIDSLSHAWNDEGGLLSLNRRIAAQKYRNNTASAWLDTDPIYRRFVNAITDARLHIIATMRSKSEIDISKDENGQTRVTKLGTKVVQRDELEFEFTIYCRMEIDNTLVVEKTRCRHINGAVVKSPTGAFLAPVKTWLDSGAPDEHPLPERDPRYTLEAVKAFFMQVYRVEANWEPFKSRVIGFPVADEGLSDGELLRLYEAIEQGAAELEKRKATTKQTQAPEQPDTPASDAPSDGSNMPATEQQLASMRKLCQHLGKAPIEEQGMTYEDAKTLIINLSKQYNESRQSRKAS